jgi:hypothetical protein
LSMSCTPYSNTQAYDPPMYEMIFNDGSVYMFRVKSTGQCFVGVVATSITVATCPPSEAK